MVHYFWDVWFSRALLPTVGKRRRHRPVGHAIKMDLATAFQQTAAG